MDSLADTMRDSAHSKQPTFIDLFAGLGGIRLGFENAGCKCVFSSEWDKDAQKSYKANFGEIPHGDITHISADEIPHFDILCAGFPCQPFSIIGDKEGFKHTTQGTLFFEIERFLRERKPRAFMLENVRNLISHDKGRTFAIILEHLANLGYFVHFKVLNALDFGLPQKRERVIICGFREKLDFAFPSGINALGGECGDYYKPKSLAQILESSVDKKYFVREAIKISRTKRMKKQLAKPYITHENVGGSITAHHFSCALRAGASANYLLVNNERRLSEREMLRLQGFPESYKIVVPYSAFKKQIGNSVALPVIEAVARQMLKAMQDFSQKQNLAQKAMKNAPQYNAQNALLAMELPDLLRSRNYQTLYNMQNEIFTF